MPVLLTDLQKSSKQNTDIVKYNNNLNQIDYGVFTATDMNVLMALCSIVRPIEGVPYYPVELEFDYKALRKLMDIPTEKMRSSRFTEQLLSTNRRIQTLYCAAEGKIEKEKLILFSKFVPDAKTQKIVITVNSKFRYLFTSVFQQFTKFALEQFVEIKSKHAKILYCDMCQWQGTKIIRYDIEDFYQRFRLEKSYAQRNIASKILNPAIQELTEKGLCKNVKLTTIKADDSTHAVQGFEIIFDSVKQK